jgi:hypothetical protein
LGFMTEKVCLSREFSRNFMALNIPMWFETKIKQQMRCRS